MGYTKPEFGLIGLRLSLGFVFFWAFIDKLFGLGFSTKAASAWLAGGSPTAGFLTAATTGPLKPFYASLAGSPVIDVLFMTGLLGVGVSLLLGIGLRLGGYSGALMMFLMWTALLLPKNNPVIDEHIVYLFALIYLAHSGAGRLFGLGKLWSKTKLVKKFPVLE